MTLWLCYCMPGMEVGEMVRIEGLRCVVYLRKRYCDRCSEKWDRDSEIGHDG